MNTLSKEAEDRILDAIQDVCQHVNGGDSPTDAVVKVAEEKGLSPNFVRLVCTGYNTGATTYQREKSAAILDKMAEFPLADVDEILGRLYPADVKSNSVLKQATVVDDVYTRTPRIASRPNSTGSANGGLRQKTSSAGDISGHAKPASERSLPAEERMKHAYNQALDQKRAMETKRAEYSQAQDLLLMNLGRLAELVKIGTVKLAELEYVANTYFGQDVYKAIGGFVRDRLPKHIAKQSADLTKVAVDWKSEPYKTLEACIKMAKVVNRLSAEYRAFETKTQTKIAELVTPFDFAQNQVAPKSSILNTSASSDTLTKEAWGFLGGLLGGALTRQMGQIGQSMPIAKPPGELSSGMAADLDDPEHDSELRKIQSRAMLQDLMMNDEVISGYDPSDVLDAYNEIVNVTPRSGSQAAIMRPLLRKRLTQGAIEPFEAAEMVNIEKNLGQTQKPGLVPEETKRGAANVLHHRILG
jgi:hypothetical protein